jgi:hypothetical protein
MLLLAAVPHLRVVILVPEVPRRPQVAIRLPVAVPLHRLIPAWACLLTLVVARCLHHRLTPA